MAKVEMEATRDNMLNILYDEDDECYHQELDSMSDEKLLEEGIKRGFWDRKSSQNLNKESSE